MSARFSIFETSLWAELSPVATCILVQVASAAQLMKSHPLKGFDNALLDTRTTLSGDMRSRKSIEVLGHWTTSKGSSQTATESTACRSLL